MSGHDAHLQQFLEVRRARDRSRTMSLSDATRRRAATECLDRFDPTSIRDATKTTTDAYTRARTGGKTQGGVQRGRGKAHGDVLREVRDVRAGIEVFVERVVVPHELRVALPGERAGHLGAVTKHGSVKT
ncbi:hypothetical protein BE221DRAFT_205195 [Ostreococcus tauri]|uniref:Uncharacterized protein n=1 Tax=Ostreococcus tauri TaxID=70448 RepID=A0A1Y5IBY1_OSTTA|nr:hypothetical protein BE221DRAFT_205195 [Ostreococcus tauri]